LILSDASVKKDTRTPNSNAVLTIIKKDKQFVYHIWTLFSEVAIVGALPNEITIFLKETGQTYLAYEFSTFTLLFFTDLHKLWYSKKGGETGLVKIIPSNIAAILTPRALAYWISGDGSFDKTNQAICLCTDSFTPAELDLLRATLLSNFNIHSSRTVSNKERDQYRIRIPKREVPKIQALVSYHIPTALPCWPFFFFFFLNYLKNSPPITSCLARR